MKGARILKQQKSGLIQKQKLGQFRLGAVIYGSGTPLGVNINPSTPKTAGITMEGFLEDSNGLVYQIRETVLDNGTVTNDFVDITGAVVTPVAPSKPFTLDRERLTEEPFKFIGPGNMLWFKSIWVNKADSTQTKDIWTDGITVQSTAPAGPLTPYAIPTLALSSFAASSANNGDPITIPAGVKAFSIVNLGINGDGMNQGYEDTTLTGGAVYTIPAVIIEHQPSVNDDPNSITSSPIVVTPGAASKVFVSWVI